MDTSSSLQKDEVELIAKKLTFSLDYTRFRSVCKLWRSIAPKRLPLPWLIVGMRTRSFKFYELCFETNNFRTIPELSEVSLPSSSSYNDEVECIGSSHGWLALFSPSTSSVSLFNPLTNSSLDLPKLQNWNVDSLSRDTPSSSYISFYLTSDPSDESLSDCFALINIMFFRRIFYCKLGCTDWIEIPHPKVGCDGIHICNALHICCYRGKFFIASNVVSQVDVFVCDFGLFGCSPSVQKILSFRESLIRRDKFEPVYLVESNGDLLFVLNCLFEDENDGICKNYFEVFKIDFGCEPAKLVRLESLGDRTLFLSKQTTFSLTASKHHGCKENSIYSTYRRSARNRSRSVQKLSFSEFKKGSSVVINDDDDPLYVEKGEHCGWFTPSLLK